MLPLWSVHCSLHLMWIKWAGVVSLWESQTSVWSAPLPVQRIFFPKQSNHWRTGYNRLPMKCCCLLSWRKLGILSVSMFKSSRHYLSKCLRMDLASKELTKRDGCPGAIPQVAKCHFHRCTWLGPTWICYWVGCTRRRPPDKLPPLILRVSVSLVERQRSPAWGRLKLGEERGWKSVTSVIAYHSVMLHQNRDCSRLQQQIPLYPQQVPLMVSHFLSDVTERRVGSSRAARTTVL